MFGALVAIAGALSFAIGSVLQKVGAPPPDALGVRRLVRHILTSPIYLLGTGLDLVGFVLTAVAARMMPLFAVEGILSTSVGITAVLAAWLLGERLGAAGKVAVSLMVAGLVLLSVTAAPETGTTLGLPLVVLAASAVALLAFVAAFDRLARSKATPSVLAVVAGVAFGVWAAVPRLAHDGAGANAVGAVFVVIGLISYSAALRRGSTVSMMAITVAAESVLPALCGLAVGDRARPGAAGGAIAGYVLAVASAVVIAVISRDSSDSDESTEAEINPASVPSGLTI